MIGTLVTDPSQRDKLLQHLVDAATRGNGSGNCPDANQLAALAEGRLRGRERDQVVEHLGSCAACADAIAALAGEDLEHRRVARHFRPAPWLAAAAVLLVGLGLWSWFARGPAEVTVASLGHTARLLADQQPALFAGFTALDEGELAAPGRDVTRGSTVIFAPCGTLIEDRPTYAWGDDASVARWTLTLLDGSANELWRREVGRPPVAHPADAPALQPGQRYLVQLDGQGAVESIHATGSFRVASAEDERAFTTAFAAIDRSAPAAERVLLRATLAARRQYWSEAERLLRPLFTAGNSIAGRLLLFVLRQTGSPEAKEVALHLQAPR